MYYYITEPLTTNAEKKRIEEIKSVLSQLGIAGEFGVASPARTVPEHLELAFKKGFTTIVGIGSDSLANMVASTILKHNYEKAAFGFIPLNSKQVLWQMIGAHSLRDHCQTLRARHVTAIDAVQLNKEATCITSASMQLSKPVKFQLAYGHVELYGQCTHLQINTQGPIELWDATYSAQTQRKGFFANLFGAQPDTSGLSLTSFTADRWQLVTEQPEPITIDSLTATHTPLDVKHRPKALKLIVNRAKISSDKETDSSKE
jgi:diacylglycerol kinase family enzyme